MELTFEKWFVIMNSVHNNKPLFLEGKPCLR